MKTCVLYCVLVAAGLAEGNAETTVMLNNKDAGKPIVRWPDGRLAYEDTYVRVMASISAGPWREVASTETSSTVYGLTEPGYFDAGVGIIPFAASAGQTVDFTVYAWQGAPNFDDALIRGQSASWSQAAGFWDPGSGSAATGPILQIPNEIIISPAPEPGTIALSMLGGAVWLAAHNAIQTLKRKQSTAPNQTIAPRLRR